MPSARNYICAESPRLLPFADHGGWRTFEAYLTCPGCAPKMARHCTLHMTGEANLVANMRWREGGTRLMLEIQTKQVQPDIVVLEIKGRITLGGDSKQLEWTVDKLVNEGQKKVILDLAGVTNIDSTGIGIIVMSAGKVKKAGGELRVAAASAHVEEVLRMTNIDQLVVLHPSAGNAAAGF